MLTDIQARKAKSAAKAYKLADSGGLHLYVTTTGRRFWRFRYEFGGKEKLLSLGEYPALSLGAARIARDDAKTELRRGRDPGLTKKTARLTAAQQGAETVQSIGLEWHGLRAPGWTPKHAGDVLGSLTQDVFPAIGSTPIRHLGAPDVLALVRGIEGRDAKETARRVRQRIASICDYAIATGRRTDANPAAAIAGFMAPLRKGRQPAITDLELARGILADVEATPAHPATHLAMRLLAITVVRPGTLAETPWTEFDDIDRRAPMWIIPAARMKLRLHFKDDELRDHMVPLTVEALETIEALRAISGEGPYVFPNSRSAHKPMSENALGYLLNRAGYHSRHVPHGWRSTFSTVMNERHPADRAIIDLMLSHVPKDKVEGAYNRAAHMARRRELAQIWSDLIMEGRPAAETLLSGRRRGSSVPMHLTDSPRPAHPSTDQARAQTSESKPRRS